MNVKICHQIVNIRVSSCVEGVMFDLMTDTILFSKARNTRWDIVAAAL